MTWPTGSITTTNTDAGADSPASARADLLAMEQVVNQIIANGEPMTLAGTQTIAGAKTFATPPGGVPGRLLNVQVFATAGDVTYTPTAGTNWLIVEMIGGGGAGGGTAATGAGQAAIGANGGSGGYMKFKVNAAPTSPITCHVGAAGAGVSAADGFAGEPTRFGNSSSDPWYCVVNGGDGGSVGFGTSSFPAVVLGAASARYSVLGSGCMLIDGRSSTYYPPGIDACLLSATVVLFPRQESTKMMGAGQGGTGLWSVASSAAKTGLSGTVGKIVVYEYV